MKVITHWNSYRTIVCPECNCVFEYSDADIKLKFYPSHNFGMLEGYNEVICPECNKRMVV